MQPQLDQNAAAMEARLAGATATGRSADGLVTIVVGGLGGLDTPDEAFLVDRSTGKDGNHPALHRRDQL